jgi:hypothetical protein
MSDAGSKPRRSVERASQVLDRAARMSSFKPSILDRRIGDRQMRTPDKAPLPFNFDRMKANGMLIPAGVQDVPLNKVVAMQNTVSVAHAKAKLTHSELLTRPAQAVSYKGKFYGADGNHLTVARKAMGFDTGKMEVFKVHPDYRPPLITGSGAVKALGIAGNVAGPTLVAANAALAYNTALKNGKSKTEAVVAATASGAQASATGIAIGAVAKAGGSTGLLSGAAKIALRAAAPVSIAAHAVAYGVDAYRKGGDNLDIAKGVAWGAVNGIVPIDLTTAALKSFAESGQAKVPGKDAPSTGPASQQSRLSAPQQAQFLKANAQFQQATAEPAEKGTGNTKRGTQNQTNIEAINAARAAKAAANQP